MTSLWVGISMAEIARQLGVGKSTIGVALKKEIGTESHVSGTLGK